MTQRQAQVWAQQILLGLQTWKARQGERELPMDLPAEAFGKQDNEGFIVEQGQATRMCQEVNLAIKQHNAAEDARVTQVWEEQKAEAVRNKAGTVTTVNYVPNKISWVLKYRCIDPPRSAESPAEYKPRCCIYIGIPELRGTKTRSLLAEMAETFHRNMHPPVQIQRKQDPFEKWLATEPEPVTGSSPHSSGTK